MMCNHNKYLDYMLPNNWCAEEGIDNLLLYNPSGKGAITISFFSVLNIEESLDEQISIMAKRFIDKNNINIHSPLVLFNRVGKTILYGTGTTTDGWFIKLWVVAKEPKIVFATYQSEQKSAELKVCDSIIDSFQFTF
ncbi:MAG: hypothetical protein IKC61_04115 [Clostridia bacterium]|nr:hypothetical protein [Clostridia bacterium]